MAAWKRRGGLEQFERSSSTACRSAATRAEFAEQIFRADPGLRRVRLSRSPTPRASRCWCTCRLAEAPPPGGVSAALLNSQPMGFYSPAQLVQDAQRHGVEVRPVDVNASGGTARWKPDEEGAAALRLGLRLVKGLSAEAGRTILDARGAESFASTQQLVESTGLDRRELGLSGDSGRLEVARGASASRPLGRRRCRGTDGAVQVAGPLRGPAAAPEARRKGRTSSPTTAVSA